MAKASRAVHTRLAITINARYYPTEGVADGFYIDGRIPGKREIRAADLTVDREDRSFLLSVFGRPDTEPADANWADPLFSVGKQIKSGASDIDTEINNLADLAVEVTGRTTLKSQDQRQPFFSGLVVMDGEVAAVTIGDGCAYIYRNDVVYPLTRDDFALEPIDFNGNAIESLDDYIAGSAGTIRYSNIAQLETNDCLILCNLPIMEAIGQREMLRILYEAEDQSDAAGMIMTQASSKLPGESLQIAVGFVESVVAEERTGRLNLGRFATGAIPAQRQTQGTKDPDLARTQRFHSSSMSNILDEQDRMFKAGEETKKKMPSAEERPSVAARDDNGFQRPKDVPSAPDRYRQEVDPADEFISAPPLEDEVMPGNEFERIADPGRYPKSVEDLYGDDKDEFEPVDDYRDFSDTDQIQYQRAPGGSRGRDDLRSGARQAPAKPGRGRSAYDRYEPDDDAFYDEEQLDDDRVGGGLFSRSHRPRSQARSQSYHDYDDDYDGDYDDYGDYGNDYARQEKTKRIIFYAVFGILILVCIFALVKLLKKGDPDETVAQAGTDVTAPQIEADADGDGTDSNITLPAGQDDPDKTTEDDTTESQAEENTGETTEATDGEDQTNGEKEYIEHEVKKGDTLWGLAKKYFPNANINKAMDAIMAANGWDDPENKSNIRVGKPVKIPTKLD